MQGGRVWRSYEQDRVAFFRGRLRSCFRGLEGVIVELIVGKAAKMYCTEALGLFKVEPAVEVDRVGSTRRPGSPGSPFTNKSVVTLDPT